MNQEPPLQFHYKSKLKALIDKGLYYYTAHPFKKPSINNTILMHGIIAIAILIKTTSRIDLV